MDTCQITLITGSSLICAIAAITFICIQCRRYYREATSPQEWRVNPATVMTNQ